MLSFVARRALITIPIVLGILFLSFIFVQLMPGDPVRAMTDPIQAAASQEYIARRRAELGLDDPIVVQFLLWMREVLQGNLGYSFTRQVPVTQMIGERVLPTAFLALVSLTLAVCVGVLTGVVSALKQNSWLDYASAFGSMAAISIPNFFLGLIAIYVFAISLGILPPGGMRTLSSGHQSMFDVARHAVLPITVLTFSLVGPYVRFARQGMLDVLHQDYMVTAKAKGAPWARVIIDHGLRNSLIPLVTVLALQVPMLLTGVLIIEVVFSWPGLGRLTFDAIGSRDYPVIVAIVLMSAVLVMAFNLLADILVAIIDPRIRL